MTLRLTIFNKAPQIEIPDLSSDPVTYLIRQAQSMRYKFYLDTSFEYMR